MLTEGAHWYLLNNLFNYDYTLEEGGVDADETTNEQKAANNLAKTSLKALAYLSRGVVKSHGDEPVEVQLSLDKTPRTMDLIANMNNMLTPYVVRRLADEDYESILKMLNTNESTPYFIWDNSTRGDLCNYLETRIQRPRDQPEELFTLQTHQDELLIGDVFVSVYNDQPTFTLEKPNNFINSIMGHITGHIQKASSRASMEGNVGGLKPDETELTTSLVPALQALENCLKHQKEVDTVMGSHLRSLFIVFDLIRVVEDYGLKTELCNSVLSVIKHIIANNEIVAAIAKNELIWYLYVCMNQIPKARSICIETIANLLSNPQLAKQSFILGGVVMLLGIIASQGIPEEDRKQAEAAISRLMSDRLSGPRSRLQLGKLIPVSFADAFKDGHALQLWDSMQENPELVWDDTRRTQVQSVLFELSKSQCENLIQKQGKAPWNCPPPSELADLGLSNILEIEGVYVSLLIQQPGWQLRRPREFVLALLDKIKSLKNGDDLQTCIDAAHALFMAQPNLSHYALQSGHVNLLISRVADLQCVQKFWSGFKSWSFLRFLE